MMEGTYTEATLTLEEEQALGRRAQAGDEAALNQLVEANLRFAAYLAYRYRREGVDIDDLIQEANIGLLLAARRYDPERGVRFASYAGWWIEAQLRRYLSRHASAVRISEGTRQIRRRLRQAEERLVQEHDHVTLEMIAAEADVDLQAAEFALGGASATPLSLDQTIGEVEGEFTLQDTVADASTEQAFNQVEITTILTPLLENLEPRHRQILQMRYEENRTCNEIGSELGLSGSRVQQLEVQAIRHLRHQLMMPYLFAQQVVGA
jgi:RNA polymerase sigma factor (sigma-70 family)